MGILDGKVVIITGGARGVGRSTALAYAREGARVVVADIDAKAIEDSVADTKKAIEGDDVEAINKAIENLTQASHRLAEVMYQSAPQDGREPPPDDPEGSSEGTSEGQPDDEVIDAEYVDVDEKK